MPRRFAPGGVAASFLATAFLAAFLATGFLAAFLAPASWRLGRLRVLGPARRDARWLARHLRVDGRPRRVLEAGGEVALVHVEQRLQRLRPLVDAPPTGRRRAATPRRHRRDRAARRRRSSSSSSHENGVDTCAPGRARTDHAPNTVLCGAFWLKSMKTRSPRSSFHHASVIRSGRRRASSPRDRHRGRPAPGSGPSGARAGRRRGCRGCRSSSAGPRCRARRAASAPRRAATRTSSKPTPGWGSRSMRSSSACSGSAARFGHTWKPRQPRFTAHTTCARSAATSAREVVPFGVLTIVVSSQSGASSGTRFWKNDEPRDAVREPLHQHRPPTHRPQQRRLDRLVVPDEVELGLAPLGEHHLVGAGHADRAARHLDLDRLVAGHRRTVPALAGANSPLTVASLRGRSGPSLAAPPPSSRTLGC